ncbi:TrbI/VirB10 family protein [Caenibius sp. WL]|uniref:TrbI/VirB10 family protein n=1 Tax=Caenibius sp. WL TaxID=2872646 RepID=UPI001C993E8C|nr:TrbI/VirB10 family protein [Caenibius sp. WL]QZP09143.1 hypothetical protein K5X80_05075 [Caenibius sp. WL]
MNLHVPSRRDATADAPGTRHPVVALPRQGLPGFVIAIIAGLCAIALFLVLNAQRKAPEEAGSLRDTDVGLLAPAPPPLVIPPEIFPSPVLAQPIAPLQPQYPVVRQAQPQLQQSHPVMTAPREAIHVAEPMPYPAPPPLPFITDNRPPPPTFTEPAIVFDAGAGAVDGSTNQQQGEPRAPSAKGDQEPSSKPAQQARLERIRNPETTVPTGTLIRATLETPVDTSRSGFARAIISKDVRGFKGRRILIPRGSRLVGEYASDVRAGQNRVLLNWTHLLRPDGSMIRLDSPAADAMGGAGVPGRVHSFFFQRFTNALLQTAINLGGSYAAYSSHSPVLIGIPNTAVTNVAGQTGTGLIGQGPQPKITVKQGAVVNIFVARDLDFSGVSDRSQATINGQ